MNEEKLIQVLRAIVKKMEQQNETIYPYLNDLIDELAEERQEPACEDCGDTGWCTNLDPRLDQPEKVRCECKRDE